MLKTIITTPLYQVFGSAGILYHIELNLLAKIRIIFETSKCFGKKLRVWAFGAPLKMIMSHRNHGNHRKAIARDAATTIISVISVISV